MLLSLLFSLFTMVELNCENLFDCQHDSLKQDEAFTPQGMYHWTNARYWKKVNNIGREILACGQQKDGTFSLPDVVALCEVENDTVMRDLTQRSILRSAGYEYVITDSPDERGIDVALMYSPMTFSVVDTCSIRVKPLKDMRPTRDILYVKGHTATNDTLHIFVVHAPSRSGGEYETRANRMVVAERLTESVDSIRRISPEAKIIVAGDFNDYNEKSKKGGVHGNQSLGHIEKYNLTDISENAIGRHGQAQGTYKFHGEWASLDHIFLSDTMKPYLIDCEIGDFSFLLTDDDAYGGCQPNRNIQGVKWRDGFSDHLPLIMHIAF